MDRGAVVSRFLIAVEIDDPDFVVSAKHGETFKRRLQSAFDHEWPYSRMETVRVLWIVEDNRPGPTSTETDS